MFSKLSFRAEGQENFSFVWADMQGLFLALEMTIWCIASQLLVGKRNV